MEGYPLKIAGHNGKIIWIMHGDINPDGEVSAPKDSVYFYKSSNIFKNLDGSNKWISLNTQNRIYYDSVVILSEGYPVTGARLDMWAQQYSPVFRDTSILSTVFWEFYNISTNKLIHQLKFNNFDEIATFINNNVDHQGSLFTEYCVLRAYDIVDNNIPKITKVHGYNRLFGSCKGGEYRTGVPHCGNMSDSSPYSNVLYQMFITQFPNLAPFTTINDFEYGGNGRHVIFLPASYKSIYTPPGRNSVIVLYSGLNKRGRYDCCENWENFNPISTASNRYYDLLSPKLIKDSGEVFNLGYTSYSGYKKILVQNLSFEPIDLSAAFDDDLSTYFVHDSSSRKFISFNQGALRLDKLELVISSSEYASFELYLERGDPKDRILIGEIEPEPGDSHRIHTFTNLAVASKIELTPTGGGSCNIEEIRIYYKTSKKIYYSDIVDLRSIRKEILSSDGSFLLFYAAVDNRMSFGDRNCAIYAKPWGIDTINVNYVDETNYILEGVYYQHDRQKTYFKSIQIDVSDPLSDSSRIQKDQWISFDWYDVFYTRHDPIGYPEIYFRLRDKQTNGVSELSDAKVVIKNYFRDYVPMFLVQ